MVEDTTMWPNNLKREEGMQMIKLYIHRKQKMSNTVPSKTGLSSDSIQG